MATETVRLDWLNEQLFVLRDRNDFPIVMTQPTGVNAADLLPMSVIGCSAWDILAILLKQRQHVTAMQVTADSEREDEPPWKFKKIHIHYKLTGRNLDAEQVKRAIELTETKYCSTYATLKDVVDIQSTLELIHE
jgi:putative redox protein